MKPETTSRLFKLKMFSVIYEPAGSAQLQEKNGGGQFSVFWGNQLQE